MRVLGVDTASDRKDRGYAIADAGQLVWYGSAPPPREAGPIDFVAGERPWEKKRVPTRGAGRGGWSRGAAPDTSAPGLSGENLITFAMNNGFQLRDAWPYEPWPVFVALTVRQWKDLALPGCAGYPGDVYCANFRQKYAPHVSDHNQLDAMGIALAASRLSAAELKKLVQKGFQR